MAAPQHRCPFKNNGANGLQCEATNCMAYDSVNETCKILEAVEAYIEFGPGKGFDPSLVKSNINN